MQVMLLSRKEYWNINPDRKLFNKLSYELKYWSPTRPQKLRKSIVKFTSDMKKSIRKSNIKYALDS